MGCAVSGSAIILDIAPPPAIYSEVGPPATMIELQLSLPQINVVCRILGVDRERKYREVYGCSLWAIGGCLIIVPKVERQVSELDQSAVRAHEIAHCNGWSSDHPA